MNTEDLMAVAYAYKNSIDTVRETRAEKFLRECIDLALRHAYNNGWQQGVDESRRVRQSQWDTLKDE